jgi:hypothetical protein
MIKNHIHEYDQRLRKLKKAVIARSDSDAAISWPGIRHQEIASLRSQ